MENGWGKDGALSKKTVLITGVSGYLGLHVAKALLEKGYEVRGTIRSSSKEPGVRKTLAVDSERQKLSYLSLPRRPARQSPAKVLYPGGVPYTDFIDSRLHQEKVR